MKSIELGEIFDITSSKRVFQSEWTEEGVPFYRAREIVKISKNGFVDNDLFISEEMYEDYRTKYGVPKEGDILITGVGTLGITYKVKKGDKFYFKDGNVIWFKKKSDVDSKFVQYCFQSQEVLRQIQGGANGATVGTYTIEKAKRTKIPLPPLATQKKIAAILDAADAHRQKTKQLLAKYDELAQSIFLEMFGDTWLNPKKWDILSVKELANSEKHSIKAGPFGSALKKEFYVESGYKIYGQEQVIKDDFDFGDYYIDESRYQKLRSCSIKTGDILISLVGTYGKISIVPECFEPGIINPRLMKISANKKLIYPEYLKILLQSNGSLLQMKNFSRGGTMDIVNVGIVSQIKLPIPPLELQKEYLGIINNISTQRLNIIEQKRESINLFNSLLQKAFKGELVS